jgi:hypothetical protein
VTYDAAEVQERGDPRGLGSPPDGTYLDRTPGAPLQSRRPCESFRSGLRLLAQTAQFGLHFEYVPAPKLLTRWNEAPGENVQGDASVRTLPDVQFLPLAHCVTVSS